MAGDEPLFLLSAVAAAFMMLAPLAAAVVGGLLGWRAGVREGREQVSGWQQGRPLA